MNCFFNTNVIVSAYDPGAGLKQVRAHELMERHAGDRTITVSTPVLQETYSVMVRKRYLDPAQALRGVDGLSDGRVVPADAASVLRGLQLSERCQLRRGTGSSCKPRSKPTAPRFTPKTFRPGSALATSKSSIRSLMPCTNRAWRIGTIR